MLSKTGNRSDPSIKHYETNDNIGMMKIENLQTRCLTEFGEHINQNLSLQQAQNSPPQNHKSTSDHQLIYHYFVPLTFFDQSK